MVPSSSAPSVSIIIATHNGAAHIDEAVRSILAQGYVHYEVIIVNDASTDHTVDILKKIADPRLRIIDNSRQLGLTRALNVGLHEACGEYVARLDDDDVWTDVDKLAKQIIFLHQHPAVGVCGTQYTIINEAGQEILRLQFPISDADIRSRILRENPFAHSSVMMRRELIEEYGAYDEKMRYAQDYELWLRFGQYTQLSNLPDYCVAKRIGTTRISQKKSLPQCWSFVRTAMRYHQQYPGWWQAWPIYVRELIINLVLPKGWQYRASRWRQSLVS
jgi:glycosyltransferase involved in cell wall biosynthesis